MISYNSQRVFLYAGDEHLTFAQFDSISQTIFSQFNDLYKPAVGSRIAVLAAHPLLLAIMARAIISNNCTCIPIDTRLSAQEIGRLLNAADTMYCITEMHLAHLCTTKYKLYIVDGLSGIAKDTHFLHHEQLNATPLILFDATTHNEWQQNPISSEWLADTFNRYNNLYNPKPSDTLLIFEEDLHARITDLLWAWYHGITIVIHGMEDGSKLDNLLPNANEFPMQFGLFYFGSHNEGITGTNKYQLLIDSVKYADEHDFAAVWTPERHFNEFGGLFPNPSVLSAALAMVTNRVQLRSGSIVSPLHHAVRIAEDWSVVDNLSNGRVALSFASGWQCNDFVFFPDRYEKRHEHMLEQIEEVKSFWKGDRRSLINGLGTAVDIQIYPKPVQPELPVWMTVSGKTESFVDAGKIGANILTHLLWQDTDELIGKIKAYRESLELNGFDPASRTVSVMAHTFLGTDNQTVKQQVKPFLMEYIRSSVHLIEAMSGSNMKNKSKKDVVGRYGTVEEEMPPELLDQLVEFAFERFFEKAGLLGTPEKARGLIRKLKGYGVDDIACLIDFGLPNDAILGALPYLNELRKTYDISSNKKYNISLLHCSREQVNILTANAGSASMMNGLRSIIIDENANVSGIATRQELQLQDLLQDFNAPIDESF